MLVWFTCMLELLFKKNLPDTKTSASVVKIKTVALKTVRINNFIEKRRKKK
jgi:hypothetical protein